VTAMFQVGGTVGAIALGQLMDRFKPQRVLGLTYALAAAFTALIGNSTANCGAPGIRGVRRGFVSRCPGRANALRRGLLPDGGDPRATGVSWPPGFVGLARVRWAWIALWSLPVVSRWSAFLL